MESEEFNIIDLKPIETEPNEIASSLLDKEEADLYQKYVDGEIDYSEFMKTFHNDRNVKDAEDNSDVSSEESCENPDDNREKDPDFYVSKKFERRLSRARALNQSSDDDDDDEEDGFGLKDKVAALFTDDYASTVHTLKPRHLKSSVLKLTKEQNQFLSMAETKLNTGDFLGAIEICDMILEQCPGAPETYLILSDIYYRQGNIVRSREYMLKAAHRRPSDVNSWLNLVSLCEELGDKAAAHFYLYKAVRMSKYDPELTEKLIGLLQENNEVKEVLHLKLLAFRSRPETDPQVCYEKLKGIHEELMKLKDHFFAIKALLSFFNLHPDHGRDEDRLVILKLYWNTCRYDDMIRFAITHCGVKIITKKDYEVQARRARFNDIRNLVHPHKQIEFTMELNLEIKMYILFILFFFGLANNCESFLRRTLDVLPDSMLDHVIKLASVALQKDTSQMSLYIAERLLEQETNANNATLWCILAKAQSNMGQYAESMQTYENLIQNINPQCIEARLELGTLYQRFNRNEAAFDILKVPKPIDFGCDTEVKANETLLFRNLNDQSEQVSIFDDPGALRIRYERCRMLGFDASKEQEFFEDSWNFLYGELISIIGNSDNRIIFAIENLTRTQEMLKKKCPSLYALADLPNEKNLDSKVSKCYKSVPLHPNEVLGSNQVTGSDLWQIYELQRSYLMKKNDLDTLLKSTLMVSLMPYVLENEERKRLTSSLLISLGLILKNKGVIFDQLKNFVYQWREYNQFWNLLNYSIQVHRGSKYAKYFSRIYDKKQKLENLALAILLNNDSIHRGSIRYAIISLATLRNRYPTNPYISLALGACYLNLSMHKHIVSRHPYVVQSFGFLSEYFKKRKPCPESYFNIARACHQLLINNLAIHFYEKALELEPIGNNEEDKRNLDIRLLAAYNLYNLYRFIGSTKMATLVLHKHLVII